MYTLDSAVHVTVELTYVRSYSKECIEIVRLMVVTWLVHVGLSASASQKPYISEKAESEGFRLLKSGP